MFPSPRTVLACLTAGLCAGATLHADQQDAAPVDVNKLLKDLKTLQDQGTTQSKTSRQAAIAKIGSVAGSAPAAVDLWEQAIRATQIDGGGKEDSTFRAWLASEGDLFKETEVQSAVHLQMEWLLLSLQRANGTPTKDLLTNIINFTRELIADQAMMDALNDSIKAEKEPKPGVPAPRGRNRGGGKADPGKYDEAVKRTHDSILRTEVGGTVVAQWLKIGDLVQTDKWEQVPGNLDGIYKNIIQPELREEKDPRVFDYWDFKLKREADLASKTRLTYEMDKFNTARRPSLLWEKAQEYGYIGQKNRAITEMLTLIKTYPNHEDVQTWISWLTGYVAPPATTATAAAPTSAAPVAPPAPIAAPAPVAPPPPLGPNVSPATAALPGAQ